jgi:hypothetical protein
MVTTVEDEVPLPDGGGTLRQSVSLSPPPVND